MEKIKKQILPNINSNIPKLLKYSKYDPIIRTLHIRNNIDINHKNLYFLILNLCFNLFFNFVFISVNWNNNYTQ